MSLTAPVEGREPLVVLPRDGFRPVNQSGRSYSKSCISSSSAIILAAAVALTIFGTLALVGLRGGAPALAGIGYSVGRTAAIVFTTIGSVVTACMLSSYLKSCCNPKAAASQNFAETQGLMNSAARGQRETQESGLPVLIDTKGAVDGNALYRQQQQEQPSSEADDDDLPPLLPNLSARAYSLKPKANDDAGQA